MNYFDPDGIQCQFCENPIYKRGMCYDCHDAYLEDLAEQLHDEWLEEDDEDEE